MKKFFDKSYETPNRERSDSLIGLIHNRLETFSITIGSITRALVEEKSKQKEVSNIYPKYVGPLVSKEVAPVISVQPHAFDLSKEPQIDPSLFDSLAAEQKREETDLLNSAYAAPSATSNDMPANHPSNEEEQRIAKARQLVDAALPGEQA